MLMQASFIHIYSQPFKKGLDLTQPLPIILISVDNMKNKYFNLYTTYSSSIYMNFAFCTNCISSTVKALLAFSFLKSDTD